MGTRHPNHRLVKIHRCFTILELADVLGVRPNTIRHWRHHGLAPIDDHRPMLFKGSVVVAFLKARREDAKQPCGPGKLYCLSCRSPQWPAGDLVEFTTATASTGTLCAVCPCCDRLMFRRATLARLAIVMPGFDVSVRQDESHLSEGRQPFVKRELAVSS